MLPTLRPIEKKYVVALISSGILLTLVFLAGHNQWRSARQIPMGERREGFLRQNDPVIKDVPPGPQARWTFDGQQGQQVTLSAESYEFDIYLLLFDQRDRQVGWGDNNGRFFNAQIQLTLPATGRYTALVCGVNADQYGTYWISLESGCQEVSWERAAVESYYLDGMKWCERKASRRGASRLNLGFAEYFRERKQWDEAEKYYAESLENARKCDFVYGEWAVALARSRLLIRRRQGGPAVSQLELALDLSKKLKSAAQAETRVLIEFGNLYYSTARPDLARVYFRAVEKQAEQSTPPSILLELYTSLNDILKAQEKEKAIDYAEKAYALGSGVDPAAEMKAIHALAGTYLLLKPGRSGDGSGLAAEMRNKAQRLGLLDQEVEATTLMSIGKYLTNDVDGMIRLAREATGLTDPADDDPTPRRIALQLQADGEILRGNHEAALKSCVEALHAVETAWAKESVEELRRELLSQSNAICTQIIRNLHQLNARRPSEEYARQAFDYAERSRSRSLLEQLATSRARTNLLADPQALKRDQETLGRLSAVRGKLVMLRSSGSVAPERLHSLQEERAGLIAERMRLQAEIRQSGENGLYAAQLSPLTAEQLQQKLGESAPDRVLLCYQLGIQDSFLIVLTARGVNLFKLPDRATISKAVTEWRAQISNQLSSPRPAPEALSAYSQVARRLYRMLVQPAAHLVGHRDLIIIPSDSLQDLAFESLVISEAAGEGRPRYLIEKHAVTYAPSASVLAAIENQQKDTRPDKLMLLVGDTSGGGAQSGPVEDSRQASRVLRQLPAARQEALDIAAVAERCGIRPTVWLGSEGNEDKFKHTDLSAFRFIHLATHSVSDNQDGGTSALTLFLDPAGREDGILTGDEIASLRLNADLLVLSGCETGTGQKAGAEGVVGLSRTFLIAGAKCVSVSLWRVDDLWTQRLMGTFYERLFAGRLDKSHALRLAKLKLLSRGASPSRWAAFVLTGSIR
ncbi:MAG: CHAT domain-containing protein [Blastocatellia bacterium]